MAIDTPQRLQVVLRGASTVLAGNPAVVTATIYNLIDSGGVIGTGSNVIGPGGIIGMKEELEEAA